MLSIPSSLRSFLATARSILLPVATILASTALGVLIVEVFFTSEHHGRAIRAEVYGVINWIGGFDIYLSTGIGAVVALLILAFSVKRMV